MRDFFARGPLSDGPQAATAGDTNVHIHLSAVDGASARNFLMGNAGTIVGAKSESQ
jgi:hypothetical protein